MRPSRHGTPSWAMHKGTACLNCRRRKVKCDGMKPVCGPCATSTGFDDCEFSDGGLTRTQMLEEQISLLENKIRDMENVPRGGGAAISLFQPYAMDQQQEQASPNFGALSLDSLLPIDVQRTILRNFMRHSLELFFFLDVRRFTQSMLSANPRDRPDVRLVHCVYLWGIHLSNQQVSLAYEVELLARAQSCSRQNAPPPDNVLEWIQSEVLLSQYLFRCARNVEAKYHLAAAVSLVLSSRLNQDPRILSSSMPVRIPGDLRERFQACWIVSALNNSWTTVHGSPSFLASDERSRIDLPWPVEEPNPQGAPASHTLDKFLSGFLDDATGSTTLRVRAAALRQQAIQFGLEFDPNFNEDARKVFRERFDAFNDLLQRFINTLPSIQELAAQSSLALSILIHTTAHSAVVMLYTPFQRMITCAKARIIESVRALANIVRLFDLERIPLLDCLCGMYWGEAASFLKVEILQDPQQEARSLLHALLRLMSGVRPKSLAIEHELSGFHAFM